jgi:hypothetical protein
MCFTLFSDFSVISICCGWLVALLPGFVEFRKHMVLLDPGTHRYIRILCNCV